MVIDNTARQQLADQLRARQQSHTPSAPPAAPAAIQLSLHEMAPLIDAISNSGNAHAMMSAIMSQQFQEINAALKGIHESTKENTNTIDKSLAGMGTSLSFALKDAQKKGGTEQSGLFGKLSKEIASLSEVMKGIKLVLPDIFSIKGTVSVSDLPAVEVKNFPDFGAVFTSLEKKLETINALPSIQQTSGSADISPALRSLTKQLIALEKTFKEMPHSSEPVQQSAHSSELLSALEKIDAGISQLYEFESTKPTFVPPPVTNMNINPLQGFVKTTAATVTSALTPLPGYGVLANRRAIIIYNNDANATLYYGGSDVTTANGMPVPPLSYSPILDAGVNMIVYGIVSGGSVNVRVMEISNTARGG